MEKTLEEIQKELEQNAQNISDTSFLFLDISSTCCGYTIADLNFTNKSANVRSSGCIWLGDMPHEEKYNYMSNAITTYFNIAQKIDYSVYEMYSINPKKLAGVMVIVEMIGSIRCAMAEVGIKHSSILPQSWRSTLKIKKTPEKDFKGPTKARVLEYCPNIPEKVVSNITGKERGTPSDLYDSFAICLAWLQRNGFNTITFNNIKFQEHVGVLQPQGV